MAADDHVSAGPGEQPPEFVIGDIGVDPRSVVRAGRCMHAKDGRPARQLLAQLRRETGQDIEQPALIQDAAGPGDPRCHGRVAFHQVDAADRVGDGRMRSRLLTRQHIAVSVTPQHGDARQAEQKLNYLDRARAEQDKVAERPPAIHSEPVRVRQHRA